MSILQERAYASVERLIAVENEKRILLGSLEKPLSASLIKALAKKHSTSF